MSILDTIDGTLADYAVSRDAVRWVPEEKRPEEIAPAASEMIAAFGRAMNQAAEGIQRMFAALQPVFEAQARTYAEFIKSMAPIAKVLNEVRAERVSAMHREYRRRSNARRRRR